MKKIELSEFEKSLLKLIYKCGFRYIAKVYDSFAEDDTIVYAYIKRPLNEKGRLVSQRGDSTAWVPPFIVDNCLKFIGVEECFSIEELLPNDNPSPFEEKKYEIGDKVYIRGDLFSGNVYGGVILPPHIVRLIEYQALPFTIVDVDKSRNRYKLEGIDFYFTTDMLK